MTALHPGVSSVPFTTLDWRGVGLTRAYLRAHLPRPQVDVAAALSTVEPILADVREKGAAATLEYSQRFDGVRPQAVKVPAAQLQRALRDLDPQVREALELAVARVRSVCEFSVPSRSRVQVCEGGVVGEVTLPVERVGLYVPGGRAVLPSSVVMNVVPAQVAGVGEIVVASPPSKAHDGWPHPTILAACALVGVTDVLAVGGAQAIALLAYGDGAQQIDPVDLITGPGNVYVAAAKRAVKGVVGIDSEAGPTEIAILADASANARYVAADLISQAEHDPMAASVLVTPSEELISQVQEELAAQVAHTTHQVRIREALAGPQSAAILVDDLQAGLAVINAYGAEHLEIHTSAACTQDPQQVAESVRHAGAIFLGEYSPVSLGDYAAGSNHVLPTGGSARFSSGLGVHSFLRRVHTIHYTREGLASSRRAAETLALAENLPAHGQAISARFTPNPLGASGHSGEGAGAGQ